MNRFYIGIVVLVTGWLTACRETDKEMFDEGMAGIYFKIQNLKKDSTLILRQDTIVYTFAYDSEEVTGREVCIPLELIGDAGNRERNYRVEVKAAENTVEGRDYEPIVSEQVFPAGKITDSLRITWKRNSSMHQEVKKLDIAIVLGGDFSVGLEEKVFVSLQVSDILEKPLWWDDWEDGFGSWHPTKLREWIKIWGRKDLPVDPWFLAFAAYPQECTAIVKLHDLFERKEFYDENGVRLYVPANIN